MSPEFFLLWQKHLSAKVIKEVIVWEKIKDEGLWKDTGPWTHPWGTSPLLSANSYLVTEGAREEARPTCGSRPPSLRKTGRWRRTASCTYGGATEASWPARRFRLSRLDEKPAGAKSISAFKKQAALKPRPGSTLRAVWGPHAGPQVTSRSFSLILPPVCYNRDNVWWESGAAQSRLGFCRPGSLKMFVSCCFSPLSFLLGPGQRERTRGWHQAAFYSACLSAGTRPILACVGNRCIVSCQC